MAPPRREGAAEAANPPKETKGPRGKRPKGCRLFWMLFRTVWVAQKNVNSSFRYPPLSARVRRSPPYGEGKAVRIFW
eukprot:2566055-Prymnesium_polylepis.1